MTKAQFLTALAGYPLVNQVDPAVKFMEDLTAIDKLYSVRIRKLQGNRVNYESINFVVVREGTAQEAAYFYQRNTITFANTQENGEIPE